MPCTSHCTPNIIYKTPKANVVVRIPVSPVVLSCSAVFGQTAALLFYADAEPRRTSPVGNVESVVLHQDIFAIGRDHELNPGLRS